MANSPLGNVGNIASVLMNVFGQPGHGVEDYRQFAQQAVPPGQLANQQAQQQIDPQEIQNRYQHVVNNVPPQILDQAHQQALSQLNPQQLSQLAQQLSSLQQQGQLPQQPPVDPRRSSQNPVMLGNIISQLVQQNPQLVTGLLGNAGGMLSNPMVQSVLAMVVNSAVQQIASHAMQQPGLLGSLAGQFAGGALPQQSGGAASGLGGALGGGAGGGQLGQILQGLGSLLGH